MLDEWEVHALVAMGDELVRAVKTNPNLGLPKLTMEALDQTLSEARGG